jgi:hypothetical protein
MDQTQFNYELTVEEMKIMDILQSCKGKGAAILGPTISSLTGIKYDEVRAVISHLVNEHHCLIASYSRGYYVPVTAEEIAAATRSLRHRGISILVRASRLQKISLEDIFNQAKFEFKEN